MNSSPNVDKTSNDPAGLVAVDVYLSPHEAHLARSLLDAHGIRSRVTGDELAGTLSYYGAAIVKIELLTESHRATEAQEVLRKAKESRVRCPWDKQADLLWRCGECRELNAQSFDECWGCQAERPDDPELVPPEPQERELVVAESSYIASAAIEDDTSPYRAPATGTIMVRRVPHPDTERRAFRAAAFGIQFPFPLAIYAFGVCINSFIMGVSSRRMKLSFVISIIGMLEIAAFVAVVVWNR